MRTFLVDCYTNNVEQSQKIDKFLALLSKSGVCDLVKEIREKEIKELKINYSIGSDFYNMLAAIIFNFAFDKGTLRDMETRCKNDLRYIYILQDIRPSHTSFKNYINKYILPIQGKIFSFITKTIFEECNINMDKMYLDGSKYEANANKYKFVWKPTTFHKRVGEKIKTILSKYNLLSDDISNNEIIESKIVKEKLAELTMIFDSYDLTKKENKDKKDDFELMVECLNKSLDYEEKERICGPNRNSYYKTDYDSTAMCLKSDYYSGLGSNMHAAYNTQISVSNGLITAYLVTQSRADINDLIPLLEKYYEFYNSYPRALCADSGYGSSKNYQFLEKNNIKNFVKYFTWEGNVSGKYPSQYRLNEDETITCLNDIIGHKSEVNRHHKKANSTFYKVEGCNNCDFSTYCKRFMKNKKENFKYFEVDIQLQKYIQQAENNLLSIEGIEMRVNRSSQVEGAFGVIKQDFQYERFRRRSLPKVSCEFMLVCLGYNIRKLFRFYSEKAKFDYWKAPEGIEPEKFKKRSAKRLSNRAAKMNKKTSK